MNMGSWGRKEKGGALGDAAGLVRLPGGVCAAGVLLDLASALAVRLRESCPDFFSETLQLLVSAERRVARVEAAARGCCDGAGDAATAEARLRKLSPLRQAARLL